MKAVHEYMLYSIYLQIESKETFLLSKFCVWSSQQQQGFQTHVTFSFLVKILQYIAFKYIEWKKILLLYVLM